MLFRTPALYEPEEHVLARIGQLRDGLRNHVTEERQWAGLLRRVTFARAIQGSNSIEGINISLDDAIAAVGDADPRDEPVNIVQAIMCYRDAMTYVIQLANDADFEYDGSVIKSLHYMMMKYDLDKSPGLWRPGPIYVRDERTQDVVYEGPDAVEVPGLMEEFVESLRQQSQTTSATVRAAMAHLNLAMIHPFRDGNGRMARGVQTLVLAREGILAPALSSIEEYLGRNTDDYYAVLAEVGGGSWQPQRDARPWLRFVLTAHFRQAATLVRRANEAEQRWEALARTAHGFRLDERTVYALFTAAQGFRVWNARYRELADISTVVAGRDLKQLADQGLLEPIGERRGRYYVASDSLKAIEQSIREDRPRIADPFEQSPQQTTLPLTPSPRSP